MCRAWSPSCSSAACWLRPRLQPSLGVPSACIGRVEGLPLSGPGLLALMRPVLARGLPFRFRAGGGSMSPWIKDGDVISIIPLGPRSPILGEIVAFVHPASAHLMVHRVIARRSGAFLTQGDNLPPPTAGSPPRPCSAKSPASSAAAIASPLVSARNASSSPLSLASACCAPRPASPHFSCVPSAPFVKKKPKHSRPTQISLTGA